MKNPNLGLFVFSLIIADNRVSPPEIHEKFSSHLVGGGHVRASQYDVAVEVVSPPFPCRVICMSQRCAGYGRIVFADMLW